MLKPPWYYSPYEHREEEGETHTDEGQGGGVDGGPAFPGKGRPRHTHRERERERERDTHIPSTLHVTATLRQELVIYPGLRVGGYTQTWDQGPPASQLVCQSPTERNSLRDCGFCC